MVNRIDSSDDQADELTLLRRRLDALESSASLYKPLGRRNLLHNAQFAVSQRYGSGSGVSRMAAGTEIIADRYTYAPPITTSVIYPSYPAPTSTPFKTMCIFESGVTAATLATAGQFGYFRQLIEGQDLIDLQWGTAAAKPVVFSFYAYTNSASPRTMVIEFERYGRSISRSVTISNLSTLKRVFVTIPGDTTTVTSNNNAGGLAVNLWFGASSTYNGGAALNTSWGVPASDTRAFGQYNFYSVPTQDIFFTGLQLEQGISPTQFEFLPYADDLRQCQRYYEESGFVLFTGPPYPAAQWKTQKRSQPTVTVVPQVGTGGTVNAGTVGYGDLHSYAQGAAHSTASWAKVNGSADL